MSEEAKGKRDNLEERKGTFDSEESDKVQHQTRLPVAHDQMLFDTLCDDEHGLAASLDYRYPCGRGSGAAAVGS
ncbi:hypothetical protein P7K49_027969 [Saguinus oedipus]|uniref:Uncharacterized protein n=1 Tax=Saguinus oedipus TaxID=9490 RepID=A0ABQ9UB61_SAGOE|nr:hypothetical protein P7K49_027969 [Saguinus oedipus]